MKEEFINVFNRLENHLRIELGITEYATYREMLRKSKNRVINSGNNLDILKVAGDLRNIIMHNNDIALPTDAFLDTFKEIVEKIERPKRLKDIMIKYDNLKICALEDSILKAYKLMTEYKLTSIPIVDDKKLLGVFSEATIISNFINEDGELIVDLKRTCFKEQLDAMNIEQHPSLNYKFKSENMDIYEAEEIFLKDYSDEKRTEIVFVTHRGRNDERLLGIVTIYDLLKAF